MEPDAIAIAIRGARLYAGLTQKQVADALEKSQTTVAAWETGRSQPDAKTLVQLSALFRVSSDFLLGISPFPDKSSETFLETLLGEESSTLPQNIRNSLSQFASDLCSLCKLIKLTDIELLPYAIDSLTAVLRILAELTTTYADYAHIFSINRAAANLLSIFDSLPSEEQSKALSAHEQFGKLLTECSGLNEMMKDCSPKELANEALRKIEKAGDSLAVFALHLYAELSLIADPPEEGPEEN